MKPAIQQRFFIAGTDTEVGKTFVSQALLAAAAGAGLSTAALKPIAAGCEPSPAGLRNEDALALQQAMSTPLTYPEINPIALEPGIAPHIAAAQVGCQLSASALVDHCLPVLASAVDFVLVEGAGGWRVPLNGEETLADTARLLGLPVILVVGLRLGCINHGLLTAEAIRNDGLRVAGWVANQVAPEMPVVAENIATLSHYLQAPCLGHIPFMTSVDYLAASQYLDMQKLVPQ